MKKPDKITSEFVVQWRRILERYLKKSFTGPRAPMRDAIGKLVGSMVRGLIFSCVKTKRKSWKARRLQPAQSSVYLGKTLRMAIMWNVQGGELDILVTKDNRLLDGHHRWAATMLNNPDANITGTEANIGLGDLIEVCQDNGKVYPHQHVTSARLGDITIYKSTIEDAMEALATGVHMNWKYFNGHWHDGAEKWGPEQKTKALAWLKSIGGKEVLAKRLDEIRNHRPPARDECLPWQTPSIKGKT